VSHGYDIAAVDWFLEELLRREDQPEPDQMAADPWRDVPVANHFTWPGPGWPGEPSGNLTRRARRVNRAEARHYLLEECQRGWRGFDLLPGVHLWRNGGWPRLKDELRTAEQQAIATVRPPTITTGGRNFTWKEVRRERYSDPVIAEIIASAIQDSSGHFDAETSRRIQQARQGEGWEVLPGLWELIDDAGAPILYVTGMALYGTGMEGISFPDQRRLRFRIRGAHSTNGIMTAVDQAGNRIARYRITSHADGVGPGKTAITVNPSWELADDLVLAITAAADWLTAAFGVGSQGGERPLY
jgi:hypothetical protein